MAKELVLYRPASISSSKISPGPPAHGIATTSRSLSDDSRPPRGSAVSGICASPRGRFLQLRQASTLSYCRARRSADALSGVSVCRTLPVAGIRAELKVHGQTVTSADPSGGTFNAVGDCDRLLPVTGEAFPILARIGPFSDVVIAAANLAALASEAAQLLKRADEGAARSAPAPHAGPDRGRASQAPNSGSSGIDRNCRR